MAEPYPLPDGFMEKHTKSLKILKTCLIYNDVYISGRGGGNNFEKSFTLGHHSQMRQVGKTLSPTIVRSRVRVTLEEKFCVIQMVHTAKNVRWFLYGQGVSTIHLPSLITPRKVRAQADKQEATNETQRRA
ncbi:hypothetical protein RND71_016469 [Anisodus tanguticus]|uniref:Uncharacterized protein n=1 Tax=Anisodus tanguticus TaxID=243964 RepID=A0AAE1VIL4_9SOLA|nr:hypothetical protein RND71_016469 [Anisodus tanguticus]